MATIDQERALRDFDEQRGNFILENQRQHHDLLVLGTAKLLHEARVHFGHVGRGHDAVLIGVGRRTGGHVQGKIFDGIVLAQTAGLPSARRSGFDDEQREARLGDRVKIVETRPMSKLKRWRLAEVLTRSTRVN